MLGSVQKLSSLHSISHGNYVQEHGGHMECRITDLTKKTVRGPFIRYESLTVRNEWSAKRVRIGSSYCKLIILVFM